MKTFQNFVYAHLSEGIIFRYKNELEASGWFCRFFTQMVWQYDRLGLVWKTGSNFNDDLGKNFPTLREIRKKIFEKLKIPCISGSRNQQIYNTRLANGAEAPPSY